MDKKDLILREAERLFSEKGYYGLGLTELLTACDIPKGSFYYYFPKGKMQLLQETLEYAYRHIAEGLNWSLSQGDTALAAFERMLGFFAAGLRENRHFASRFVAMIAIGRYTWIRRFTKPAARSIGIGSSFTSIILCALAMRRR